jgi:uncharacterized protein YjiS (DUF1127 family)
VPLAPYFLNFAATSEMRGVHRALSFERMNCSKRQNPMLAQNLVDSSPAFSSDVARHIRAVAAIFHLWRQRRREREELARMSEIELKDLSLTPADQRALLRAPFWKCHPFADEDERARNF